LGIRVHSYDYPEKFGRPAQTLRRRRSAAVLSRSGSAQASACGLAHTVFPWQPLRVGRPAPRFGCGCAALGSFVVELRILGITPLCRFEGAPQRFAEKPL